MAIPYDEALHILERIARHIINQQVNTIEHVSLEESLGRVAARPHKSPVATPPFDTSAMDGYAISSESTINASEESPVVFTIEGTMAAGDDPIDFSNNLSNEILPCFEIMTGARFPYSVSGSQFDACVKIENTCRIADSPSGKKQIKVFQPVPRNANRRFAGSDFQEGDLIIEKGQTIRSRHIMALASVGIGQVDVRRRLRVGVWSTGNELTRPSGSSYTMDTNGPFLTAALREFGANVDFKGILEDDADNLLRALNKEAGGERHDLLLTTGAVSKGQFDFIPPALKAMGASIHFHGVAIRPGHPVLFACLPLENGAIPFFGLPGNPIATAACFQFLVLPFIRWLMGMDQLQGHPAKIEARNGYRDLAARCPGHLDNFKHGHFYGSNSNNGVVVLSDDQSPAKVSHFAMSRCWAHIPKCLAEKDPGSMHCYPHLLDGLE